MPYTINGIGTHYYSKKNSHEVKGECEFCHVKTTLKSYDTILWFVVLFVPLIPLGRKRICDECPSCTRHRVLPLKEWNKLQGQAQEVIEAYRRDLRNTQRATEALQAVLGIRDLPAFLKLSEQIEASLLDDSKLISLLASCHASFGRNHEAERLLRMVVEIDDSDDHRETLAANLLLQGKPEEAELFLEHIQEVVPQKRAYLVYFLAQVYQNNNKHQDALRVFDWTARVHPPVEQDKEFISLRQRSAAKLGLAKPPSLFSRFLRFSERVYWLRIGLLIGVPAVLVLMAYLGISAYMGANRGVYLVNGLPEPYDVKINGNVVTLPPMSSRLTHVSEGTLTLESTYRHLPAAQQQTLVQTSFWSRMFNHDMFVINPDQAAVLLAETHVFTLNGTPAPGTVPEPEVVGGKLLHVFNDIDYPFSAVPAKMSLSNKQRVVMVRSVELMSDSGPMALKQMLFRLTSVLTKPTVSEIALRRYQVRPQDTEFLSLFATVNSPQDVVAALEPMFQRNELDINGHRFYQTMMQRLGRDAVVVTQYEAMAAKSPDSKDAMYLFGRALSDSDYPRARKLIEQSAEGDKACPYALFWLASAALENGEFNEAVRLGERLLQQPVKVQGAQTYHANALLASGQYDRAIELSRKVQDEPVPDCINGFIGEIFALAARGSKADATDALQRMSQKLVPELGAPTMERLTQTFEAELECIATGRTDALIKCCQSSKSADTQLTGDLLQGDLFAAEKKLTDESDNTVHLLLYIAAMMQGQTELADRQLLAAIAKLEKGDTGDRRIAKALAGTSQDSTEKLLQLRQDFHKKMIIITALGIHRPEMRPACFALASKLNFSKRFPHTLIRDALAYQFPSKTNP